MTDYARLKALLTIANFEPPQKAGKRTFDDKKFCMSILQQLEGGQKLNLSQSRFLDDMWSKYMNPRNCQTKSTEVE